MLVKYPRLTAFFNAPLDFCSDAARYVCRKHLALASRSSRGIFKRNDSSYILC